VRSRYRAYFNGSALSLSPKKGFLFRRAGKSRQLVSSSEVLARFSLSLGEEGWGEGERLIPLNMA